MQFFQNDNVKVYLHYDSNKPIESFNALKEFTDSIENIYLLENRIVCKWGEFSLVEATVNMMKACIADETFEADYFYLISGSCVPIKPLATLQNFLYENPYIEFIEATDISKKRWVVDGLQEERYQYSFPYNFKDDREKFDQHFEAQKKAGKIRIAPPNFKPHFGSQWFCITAKAANYVVEQFLDEEIFDFFKQSWIPDEFAIQSLVYNIAGTAKIADKTLTYFQFNTFGKPIVFYNDHFEYLKKIPFIFARKISFKANLLYRDLNNFTGNKKSISKTISLRKPVYTYEYFKERHTSDDLGGKIGRIKDEWKDGIHKNEKKYHVLTSPCQHFLKILVDKACLDENITVFNTLFGEKNINPSNIYESYRGFSKKDKFKRDYDPTAFLYQVIHAVEDEICFAFDPCYDNEKIRDIIKWDSNAKIMVIEPKWKNKYEKAVGFLSEQQATEILDLNLQPNDLARYVNKAIWEKNKNYWIDVLNSHQYQANLDWIELMKGKYVTLFRILKNKLEFENYIPEPNLELLKMLKVNKLEKKLSLELLKGD